MAFQPSPGDVLRIDRTSYRIEELPAAHRPDYGLEGPPSVVYRLVAPSGEPAALKVMEQQFRNPALATLAERLSPFAQLPGLQACKRVVFSPMRHHSLLEAHPDLTYAILMPWVPGPSWSQVVLAQQPFSAAQSVRLAQALARTLAQMEERELAHCDLSGGNILLPALETADADPAVALVDLEQMYVPGMGQPVATPGVSEGYPRHTADAHLWGPRGDRFAGAVLLAEMLGWSDARVREAAWGKRYFDPNEMQHQTRRAGLLAEVLAERWGNGVAELFRQAWLSESLADCPTFGEWLGALPAPFARSAPAAPAAPYLAPKLPSHDVPSPPAAVETYTTPELPRVDISRVEDDTRERVNTLLFSAQRAESNNDLSGAIQKYEEALALASNPATQAELRQVLEELRARHTPPTRTLPSPSAAPPPPSSVPPEAPSVPYASYASPAEQPTRLSAAVPSSGELMIRTQRPLEEVVEAALQARAEGQYAAAEALLEEVVSRDPYYRYHGQPARDLLEEMRQQGSAPPPRDWRRVGGYSVALLLLLCLLGSLGALFLTRQGNQTLAVAATTTAEAQRWATVTAAAAAQTGLLEQERATVTAQAALTAQAIQDERAQATVAAQATAEAFATADQATAQALQSANEAARAEATAARATANASSTAEARNAAASATRAARTATAVARGTAVALAATDAAATETAIACQPRAELVSESTVYNGSEVSEIPAGGSFRKTWQLRNSGQCPWPDGLFIVVRGTDEMGATSQPLQAALPPNGTTQVSVNLTAPTAPGTYQTTWQLQNAEGEFGLGDNRAGEFGVQIVVPPPTPTPAAAALPGTVVVPITVMSDTIPWLPWQQAEYPAVAFVGFNTLVPPFDDVDARRAFAQAVAPNVIGPALASGQERTTTFLPPDVLGLRLNPDVGNTYVLTSANSLLNNVPAFNNPLTVTLAYDANQPTDRGVAEALALSWRSLNNVAVNVIAAPNVPDQQAMQAAAYHLFLSSKVSNQIDPQAYLYDLFHSGGSSYVGGGDAALDQLIIQARDGSTAEERQRLYVDIEETVNKDKAMVIPLYHYRRR